MDFGDRAKSMAPGTTSIPIIMIIIINVYLCPLTNLKHHAKVIVIIIMKPQRWLQRASCGDQTPIGGGKFSVHILSYEKRR